MEAHLNTFIYIVFVANLNVNMIPIDLDDQYQVYISSVLLTIRFALRLIVTYRVF